MICHASGDWDKQIIPGFYLYFIVQQEKTVKGTFSEIMSVK